jgi:hypothetical protein
LNPHPREGVLPPPAHGTSNSGTARHEAIVAVGRTIQGHANFLAYGDAFALPVSG